MCLQIPIYAEKYQRKVTELRTYKTHLYCIFSLAKWLFIIFKFNVK
jgi:hypothetical protein